MDTLTKIVGGIALGTAVAVSAYLGTKDDYVPVDDPAYSAPSENSPGWSAYEEPKFNGSRKGSADFSDINRNQSVPGQIFDTFIEATHDHAKEKK